MDLKKSHFKQMFWLSFVLLFSVSSLSGSPSVLASEDEKAANLDLKVMTFNLRYLNDHDPSPHTWAERKPTVKKLINMESPDIFGTQEAVYQQVKDVDEDLPKYDWIGLGREGGNKGEFMAIFFNEERFTPLEYDHYWLSDTPEVVGSTSWGNTIPRMVTWVKFLDKKTKQSFYFVNTHFDHQSEEARQKSAELISEKMEEFDPSLPVLLTGDFNAGPKSVPHEKLTTTGPFNDLWESSQGRVNEHLGTFNGFNDPTGGGPDRRIDWILSKGNITAGKIEILDYRKNGQYPSDHYPVMADVSLHY